MATFLQLVQDVARQSGTLAGGTTLASVVGVTGRAEKVVNWTAKAWTDVQNQRDQWDFLRDEFSVSLSANTARYTSASFNLTRHAKWVVDDPAYKPLTIYDSGIGVSDETALTFIPFTRWREKYDRGTQEAMRPIEYSVSNSGELCFGPVPDEAYVVAGEYFKTPQTLAANGDTPECPARFHDIIVWRALMFMALGDESPITHQFAVSEYTRLFRLLCDNQLPDIEI